MAKVQLTIEADASGARKEIDGLAGSLRGVGDAADSLDGSTVALNRSFSDLGKIAPGAGQQLGMFSGQLAQSASALGASNTQVRLLTIAARTLTGALGPVTIAIAALSAGVILYQRHAARMVEETERARERQAALAQAVEHHRARLSGLRAETEAYARTMRDLQIDIYGVIDAERARAMMMEDVQQIMLDARLVEINGIEDVAQAAEEVAFRREGLAQEMAVQEITRQRYILQAAEAVFEFDRQSSADRVVMAQARINALQEEMEELDLQATALQRLARLFPQTMEVVRDSTDRATRSIRSMREELDKIGTFAKEQALEQLAEQQRRLNAEIEHANALKREQIAMFESLADKEMEQLVEARAMRQEMLEAQAAGELEVFSKQKEGEVSLARDAEDKIAALYAQRTAMAIRAAGMIAQGLQRAADGGIKAALSQVGASLQAEGIQRSLQGAALGLLGDPRGGGLVATGAAMTAAGTAMRGAAGGGGRGISGGTAAPSGGGGTAQRGDVNINVNEGLISDPQRTAQAVAGAVRDAHTRGLL